MLILENGKEIYEVGDFVKITNDAPLAGNTIAPPVIIGEELEIKNIALDKDNNQHLDLGIKSLYNYITSWDTKEDLPSGDKIHWVHPSRVKLVK